MNKKAPLSRKIKLAVLGFRKSDYFAFLFFSAYFILLSALSSKDGSDNSLSFSFYMAYMIFMFAISQWVSDLKLFKIFPLRFGDIQDIRIIRSIIEILAVFAVCAAAFLLLGNKTAVPYLFFTIIVVFAVTEFIMSFSIAVGKNIKGDKKQTEKVVMGIIVGIILMALLIVFCYFMMKCAFSGKPVSEHIPIFAADMAFTVVEIIVSRKMFAKKEFEIFK